MASDPAENGGQAGAPGLFESERRFRLLVQSVVDYAIFMLDPSGTVMDWNAGAERIKGYSPGEIVGQHFSRFYTDEDRAAGLPARALTRAALDGRYEAEGWRVRKDGTRFWASAVIDAIRDDNGELLGFAKITRDITERMKAAAALQKAQEQIAQAQKMEALGQLTGGVAHDFNNLLMIVSGHLHSLKKLVAGDPKGMRAIDAIELAARRGESLTRQLLSFARRQRLDPVPVDLTRRMDVLRDVLSSSMGDRVKIEFDIPAEIWPVEVDTSELELALVNLAFNARDAMPSGGTIRISARNMTLHRGDYGKDIEGKFVAVAVADNGEGMPAEILPRIFDPFFTTKPTDKGTGLGLSQVHGFAHQSGGAVDVQSEIGKGTEVTLFLPKAESMPATASGSDENEAEPAGTGTVLLVEDNPEVADVSSHMLQQLGYAVLVAGNAEAALQMLNADTGIDLVLSDVVMGGVMDGLALGRALRTLRPHLPVLLATGYSKAAADVRAEFTVLRKPYQLSELGRAVATQLAHAKRQAGASNLVRART
jgi:PAS domain S-box-containing protein